MASSLSSASAFTDVTTAGTTLFDLGANAQLVTVVPEPGSVGLIAVATLVFWALRRNYAP
jgi:hypothetical protein